DASRAGDYVHGSVLRRSRRWRTQSHLELLGSHPAVQLKYLVDDDVVDDHDLRADVIYGEHGAHHQHQLVDHHLHQHHVLFFEHEHLYLHTRNQLDILHLEHQLFDNDQHVDRDDQHDQLYDQHHRADDQLLHIDDEHLGADHQHVADDEYVDLDDQHV